jgi:hypothetical protein
MCGDHRDRGERQTEGADQAAEAIWLHRPILPGALLPSPARVGWTAGLSPVRPRRSGFPIGRLTVVSSSQITAGAARLAARGSWMQHCATRRHMNGRGEGPRPRRALRPGRAEVGGRLGNTLARPNTQVRTARRVALPRGAPVRCREPAAGPICTDGSADLALRRRPRWHSSACGVGGDVDLLTHSAGCSSREPTGLGWCQDARSRHHPQR